MCTWKRSSRQRLYTFILENFAIHPKIPVFLYSLGSLKAGERVIGAVRSTSTITAALMESRVAGKSALVILGKLDRVE